MVVGASDHQIEDEGKAAGKQLVAYQHAGPACVVRWEVWFVHGHALCVRSAKVCVRGCVCMCVRVCDMCDTCV